MKLIIIGNQGVGKSSIIDRFINNSYWPNVQPTLGVSYGTKYLFDRKVKIYIWDISGNERFKQIAENYYRGADGIILVYDTTDYFSFQQIFKWINIIQEHMPFKPVLLMGNKIDLSLYRRVSIEDGANLAAEYNFLFTEVSAAHGTNVSAGIMRLITEISQSVSQEHYYHVKKPKPRCCFC